ncbi:hypothetical protein OIU76_028976 [Salix suchowensis]|nr:hypothetical protein OIU76_028976 [Salix suchowensis]
MRLVPSVVKSPEYQIVFCAGNTTVYKFMTTNMTVVSSGPTESPPPQEPSPSPPPQVKKPPSPSPPEITPPSPSPPGIPGTRAFSKNKKKADQDRVIDIVENLDAYKQSEREEITRMIKVAAWCLQDDPERRPLMSTVLKVLEGVMEVDSNLVYRFSHAMISSPAGNHHSSSAPPQASVLSNPR